MSRTAWHPGCHVRPMRGDDIAGVVALAAEEPTAPHWPVAEYYRMLDVIADAPTRRGAWVLLAPSMEHTGKLDPATGAAGYGSPLRLPPTRLPPRSLPPGTSLLKSLPPPPGQAIDALPATGPIIGFAMASHVAGVCDLEAVVVQVAWRGRRFGEALVAATATWSAVLGALRLQLEVRASNAGALQLYRRMGFTEDGRRAAYYRNPEEEAVLMSLPLQPPGAGRIA